jgi:hypothetical protein
MIGHPLGRRIAMSTSSLEQRVESLESELLALKQQFQSLSARQPNSNWVNEVAGSMKDFPEFEEVRRLMREAREQELAEFDKAAGL